MSNSQSSGVTLLSVRISCIPQGQAEVKFLNYCGTGSKTLWALLCTVSWVHAPTGPCTALGYTDCTSSHHVTYSSANNSWTHVSWRGGYPTGPNSKTPSPLTRGGVIMLLAFLGPFPPDGPTIDGFCRTADPRHVPGAT